MDRLVMTGDDLCKIVLIDGFYDWNSYFVMNDDEMVRIRFHCNYKRIVFV